MASILHTTQARSLGVTVLAVGIGLIRWPHDRGRQWVIALCLVVGAELALGSLIPLDWFLRCALPLGLVALLGVAVWLRFRTPSDGADGRVTVIGGITEQERNLYRLVSDLRTVGIEVRELGQRFSGAQTAEESIVNNQRMLFRYKARHRDRVLALYDEARGWGAFSNGRSRFENPVNMLGMVSAGKEMLEAANQLERIRERRLRV